MKKLSPIFALIIISIFFILNLFERQAIINIQQILGKTVPFQVMKNKGQEDYRVDFLADRNLSANYINLSFYFKPSKEMNLDNLFQTSDVNSGLRAELVGASGGLVVADLHEKIL